MGHAGEKLLAFLLLKGIPSRVEMEPSTPRDVGDRNWLASVSGNVMRSPGHVLTTSTLNSAIFTA